MEAQIYIDTRWIGTHGIGRFASEMSKRLHLPSLNAAGKPSSPIEPVNLWLKLLQLPRNVIVFSPGYNVPLWVVRHYVVTIHDLNHVDRPENSSVLKKAYYRYILRRAVKKAARVITVSEYSKQRIVDWAGINERSIDVVGNGVDAHYRPDVDPWKPGFEYLLCVSNRKGHKNEMRLLEAFAQSGISPDLRLVFTGVATDALAEHINALGLKERVMFAGKVREEDLPGLYRGAMVMVFPSLYEGFGLPVLEAMACGTPVLTSNVTALPEVADDAALLVDPLSVQSIAAGITRLCNDSELRKTLTEKGLQRAKQFNWDSVAAKVHAVLVDVQREIAV